MGTADGTTTPRLPHPAPDQRDPSSRLLTGRLCAHAGLAGYRLIKPSSRPCTVHGRPAAPPAHRSSRTRAGAHAHRLRAPTARAAPTRRRSARAAASRCGSTSCTTSRGLVLGGAALASDQPEAAALQALALRADAGEVLSVDEWHRLVSRPPAAQRWPLAVNARADGGAAAAADAFHYAVAACALRASGRRRSAPPAARRPRPGGGEPPLRGGGARVPRRRRIGAVRAAARRGARGGRAPRQVCVRAGDRRVRGGRRRRRRRAALRERRREWRVLALARRRAVRARPARLLGGRGGVRGARAAPQVGFLQHDLKIITGEELARVDAAAPPRVETLLKDELGLRYDFEYNSVRRGAARLLGARQQGLPRRGAPHPPRVAHGAQALPAGRGLQQQHAEAIEPEEVRRRTSLASHRA